MDSSVPVLTIDGPSGSGKSSTSRGVAQRLGLRYLDTGAMYRAVALSCVRAGVDLGDPAAVSACAARAAITFPGNRPHLDGTDVTEELRSEPVSAAASRVAMNPAVRDLLVEMQRRFALGRDVVTEGRDQGTIVFPHAEVKVFLTASPETRAARRFAELAPPAGPTADEVTYDGVLGQIRDRDDRDLNRSIAPLKPAPDAVVLDTSAITIDEAVDRLEELVRRP